MRTFFLLDPYFGHPKDDKTPVKKRCGHEGRSQECPLAYSWQRVLEQTHRWDHGGSHFLCSSPLCLETRAPWWELQKKWGEIPSSADDRPSENPQYQQCWRCRALTPGRPELLRWSLQQSAEKPGTLCSHPSSLSPLLSHVESRGFLSLMHHFALIATSNKYYDCPDLPVLVRLHFLSNSLSPNFYLNT